MFRLLCKQFDLLIAYVPEASMGTAIEMWEAHQHARVVVTITPLSHNWVVQITSHNCQVASCLLWCSLVSAFNDWRR